MQPTSRLTTAVMEQFCAIVGAAHVRTAGPGEAVGGVPAHLVVEPASEHEVAAVLRCADDARLAVIPRGGGTKLAWGNPPARADVILSLARLDHVLEHAWADLTVTVEAGCTVAQLQDTLAQHGQRLAVDVAWPERATVGGILSTNDSGALRLRYGGLRDLIIGVTLALADGTLAASGGKVVKNVAGYDLMKLATGALGTLGVITQATFRLHPLPQHTCTLSIHTRSLAELQELVLAIQDSRLAHAALQARVAADTTPIVDILLEGTAAGLVAQEATIRELVGAVRVAEGTVAVWDARQELWSNNAGGSGPHPNPLPEGEGTYPNPVAEAGGSYELGTGDGGVIGKLSILPAELARTITVVDRIARAGGGRWGVVVQATGLGWLRLDAASDGWPAVVRELRAELERSGGPGYPAGAVRWAAAGCLGESRRCVAAHACVEAAVRPAGHLEPRTVRRGYLTAADWQEEPLWTRRGRAVRSVWRFCAVLAA